jgi:hypothetical protein
MKPTRPKLITETNLSLAWAKAFLHVLQGGEAESLVVSLRDFPDGIPHQDAEISEALDSHLRDAGIPTIDQTALTIVPYKRWLRMNKPEIKDLAAWYLSDMLPRLKARCSKNRKGTYFERFVSSSGVTEKDGKKEMRTLNQLDFILSLWRKRAAKGLRPRQSALQLACFDPAKDHTGQALSGFPCLQQVSLTYGDAGTLAINAYYPTQYLFDRAYGNYLGLCQLGHLIAHEIGATFTAFTCFTACPELGTGSKASHKGFVEQLRARVGAADSARESESSRDVLSV